MSLIPYGDLMIVTPTTGDGGEALTQNFTQIVNDISGKADKVTGATAGDIATLDADGNLVDSGTALDSKADASDVAALESTVATNTTDIAACLVGSNNLSDVTNAATARANLGLGNVTNVAGSTAATPNTVAERNASGDLYAAAFYGSGTGITGLTQSQIAGLATSVTTAQVAAVPGSSLSILAGDGTVDGVVNLTLAAGNGWTGDGGSAGGDVYITAGNSTDPAADGGDIHLTPGSGGEAGSPGSVVVSGPMHLEGALEVDGVVGTSNNELDDGDGNMSISGMLTMGVLSTPLAAPGSPSAGMIYFDGTHFQGYNGSAWVQLDN